MALLGRDEILNAKDLQTQDIPVPEWASADNPDATVRIRQLTGTERDQFEASMVELKKNGEAKSNRENVRARLLILCVINERGERMFNNADVKLLGAKSAKALERVVNAVNEMNAFTDDDLNSLAEDFGDAPDGDSTTG